MTTPSLSFGRSEPASYVTASPARPAVRAAWWREPLVHFVLLGGVLFGVDRVLVKRAGDARAIVVSADVDREAKETFKATRGRNPTAAELAALHQVWLDNEVLYREGLALQVDKGDAAIRERVIFKALSVIDSNVKLPSIDDQGLRAWFEAHRSKYDEPARYDFQEAALSGKADRATVEAFVERLNLGAPGDARAGLRVFKGRPAASLSQSYGDGFVQALAALTPGRWAAVETKDGWRAVRLDAAVAPRPADYASLRGVVMHDWTDATAAELRTAAVRALTKKYDISYELPSEEP